MPRQKAQIPDEEKFDSTRLLEERTAKLHEAAMDDYEAEQERVVRDAEDKEIQNFRGLPQEGETRDQLLDRIRKLRDADKPFEVKPEGRAEALMPAFTAEQEAGRTAVAKATAEHEMFEAARIKREGEKNRADGAGVASQPPSR